MVIIFQLFTETQEKGGRLGSLWERRPLLLLLWGIQLWREGQAFTCEWGGILMLFFLLHKVAVFPVYSQTGNNKTIRAADSRAERRGREAACRGQTRAKMSKARDEDVHRDMTDCSFSI